VPDFVQTAVEEIDEQLRAVKDEASRLEAARAALTGASRRQGRSASNSAAGTSARPAKGRNARADARRPRRGANTRASQALGLVREQPGITILELAKAMEIEPNYLYRVLPRLAAEGQVKRGRATAIMRIAAAGRSCPSDSRRTGRSRWLPPDTERNEYSTAAH
jgi:hypothetical protein